MEKKFIVTSLTKLEEVEVASFATLSEATEYCDSEVKGLEHIAPNDDLRNNDWIRYQVYDSTTFDEENEWYGDALHQTEYYYYR